MVAPRRRDVLGDRERSQVAVGNTKSHYYITLRAYARYAFAALSLISSILLRMTKKGEHTKRCVLFFVVAPRRIELRIQP